MKRPIERVMVYVDGTEPSITAAKFAVCLCKETDAALLAAYIVNTRALSELVRAHIFVETEQAEYLRDLARDSERYLEHVKELADRKGVDLEIVQRSGNVNEEIKLLVDERRIDLLCVGELSRLKSRRDELYDESERAMRRVNCSVLVVKNQDRVEALFESFA